MLKGKLVEISSLQKQEIDTMFLLMDQFYEHMVFSCFMDDLNNKDTCILLFDETGVIRGFSTQKIMSLNVGNQQVHGVFSGDTIIHKEYWGSSELFKIFARNFIEYGKRYDVFYWFLISKGYKTYRMLPVFFNEFYPNYQKDVPAWEKSIMDTYGKLCYPSEYDQQSGVICYGKIKDKLKDGVADVGERQLKDKHVAYFIKVNPGYGQGNDLVCLAPLSENNLKPGIRKLLLG